MIPNSSILQAGFSLLLALLLVISFALHTVEVNHVHLHGGDSQGDHHGTDHAILDIDEYVHGIEQKFFLVLLIGVLFSLASLTLWILEWQVPLALLRRSTSHLKYSEHTENSSFGYLKKMYSDGILNPKLH